MPFTYETKSFRRHWGWKRTVDAASSNKEVSTGKFYIEPNWEKIDIVINEITQTLSGDGWEIKGLVPLISTEIFEFGGKRPDSYAAPYTEGVIVFCQRATELSHEHLLELRNTRQNARKIDAEKIARSIRQEKIKTVEGGIFKADKFLYNGVEYSSLYQAELQREARALIAEKEALETDPSPS